MEVLLDYLFIFQIVISILIILVVLLQQSEEDSFSGFTGSGNNHKAKMLSKRTSSSPFSRITMILFILFMANSLFLATLSARRYSNSTSLEMEKFIQTQDSKNN